MTPSPPLVSPQTVAAVQARVAAAQPAILTFLREICAIPSLNGQIGAVGERIGAEMRRLGFDEVRFDRMGNLLGRLGHGPRVLVYDSHIDTVGLGDRAAWPWDPFEGQVADGLLYARGACDEKGSTPGMVYGLAIARDLGLLDGWTAYYFGNMEEWCDGIAPQAFVEVDPQVRPECVVIGEPTRLQVYRGHKGRVELKVTAKGKSAHAGSNYLGDNAIYKMLPVIAGVRDLGARFPTHPFLGKGAITVSDLKVSTVSLNAVPDECVIYIDRRLTLGETETDAIEQVRALIPPDQRPAITVEKLFYAEPSYTGFVFPVDKYFPAWVLAETHPLVQAGQQARELLGLPPGPAGKWNFSTNGIYWMGKANIPAIGFGPGDEIYAHAVQEHVPLAEVVKATEFYAVWPGLLPAGAEPALSPP